MLCGCDSVSLTSDIHIYENSKIYKTFVLPQSVSDQYPNINKVFLRALKAWQDVLPIECQIFHGFTRPRGAVSINFCDIHQVYPDTAPEIIGEFIPSLQLLLIDTANGDKDDDQTYNVCLHELGHALGLPHIVGKIDQFGNSGLIRAGSWDIILPTDLEARECIMFPIVNPNKRGSISNLEKLWALHFLMHDLNLSYDFNRCSIGQEK